MSKMQAVVYPRPNEMELRQVAVPRPGPYEALVQVMSTTICATDLKIFAGQFPGTRFPHTPGHEWSGLVVAVGASVSEVAVGDRVGVEIHVGCGRCQRCGEGLNNLCLNYGNVAAGHAHIGFTVNGGLAQYCAVLAKAVHRLSKEVDYDAGAFTDNVGLVLYAVERGRLRPGERVAVIGPGAMGLIAVQVARAMGAARVVLAGTRQERLALLGERGADALVNVREVEDPVKTIQEAAGGAGADLVVEFAGTEEAARLAVLSARRGGRVVLAGATGPGQSLSGIDLSTIVRGHLEILGSVASGRGAAHRGLALLASGAVDVRPLITHHFPLDRFQEAWETFKERRDGAIRVMMHPNGPVEN
ncbi:MAG: zinc-binding dehydrogenase, partial [Dehalococcoidia bacterium]